MRLPVELRIVAWPTFGEAGFFARLPVTVTVSPTLRISTLRQDHFAYDEVRAISAVIMGHERLHKAMVEKDALYAKPDFSDEDGLRAAELEAEFDDIDTEISPLSPLAKHGLTERCRLILRTSAQTVRTQRRSLC